MRFNHAIIIIRYLQDYQSRSPTINEHDKFREVALCAIKKAKEILQKAKPGSLQVSYKNNNPTDLVTQYDFEIQKCVIRTIRDSFPDHNIFAEETNGALYHSSEYTWVIDPIDGTNNFTRNIPFYGVSMALFHHQEVILGLTYLPERDELFLALKDRDTTCNDKSVRVTDQGNFYQTVGALEWITVAQDDIITGCRLFYLVRAMGATSRQLGSMVAIGAYVAAGRYDFAVIRCPNMWDIAASTLLVEQAGGQVTNEHGASLWQNTPLIRDNNKLEKCTPGNRYVVMSNGQVHEKLLDIVQNLDEYWLQVIDAP